ncbi:hypothetical protein FQ087_17685 [Sporosarcina sp. ANT_H38]|nr:TasA family protein [Sporosarcina sp. ANT_H38]KAA0948815.1 hypothetical protein FQ087_17685 [Sporosarcina sp. ANT_H38]
MGILKKKLGTGIISTAIGLSLVTGGTFTCDMVHRN